MYFSKTVNINLSQWLECKDKNVILFHTKLTFKQWKQLKDEFEEQRDKHDELIFSLQSQILVKIIRILETELNLSWAFRMIITELNYLNQIKKQVKAWIYHTS